MDINCGEVIDGKMSVQEMGQRIFELVLATASGDATIPHLLGTDQLGRDVLARLIYGARISLAVGIATALFSGTVGVTLGLMAGFYRGRLDDLIMRLVDLQMSMPGLLMALFVLYALAAD